jgi:hypothetical protein
MTPVWAAVWAAAGAVLVLVAVWADAHARARRLALFRCRIGPPVSRWRRRSRWRVGRRRAGWAGDALLVTSGFGRLFLTPVASGVPRAATVQPLEPRRVRRLGPSPVVVQLTADDGSSLEIAVPGDCAEAVVGPFLAAALSEQPRAPRERGA